jgi:hypothetical protein
MKSEGCNEGSLAGLPGVKVSYRATLLCSEGMLLP